MPQKNPVFPLVVVSEAKRVHRAEPKTTAAPLKGQGAKIKQKPSQKWEITASGLYLSCWFFLKGDKSTLESLSSLPGLLLGWRLLLPELCCCEMKQVQGFWERLNPTPVRQRQGVRVLVAGCQKKRKSWRHHIATHSRWSDVVITGRSVKLVKRTVQPNVKNPASILSFKCWEKAGEFSTNALHSNKTGRSHLSINWLLRFKRVCSTTTLKTEICRQLEGCFQYFRLELGYKTEQIIFVMVTCLQMLKCCRKPAMRICSFTVSLLLHDALLSVVLTFDQQQRGISERVKLQELSIQETCNIVSFAPIYLILQASHLIQTRSTAPCWIVKVSSWFQSSLITLQAAARLFLGQTDNIIKSGEEVAPCS